jgi:hypothetical protein
MPPDCTGEYDGVCAEFGGTLVGRAGSSRLHIRAPPKLEMRCRV